MISDVYDDGSRRIEYDKFLEMMMHKIPNKNLKDKILKSFSFEMTNEELRKASMTTASFSTASTEI